MARPQIPPNQAGTISVTKLPGVRAFRARCRFRRLDGTLLYLEATGATGRGAETALAEKIDAARREHRQRAAGLSASGTVLELVERWLDFAERDSASDHPVERRRRPQTFDIYRAYTRTAIAPYFATVTVAETDTATIQEFLEATVATRPGSVKSARALLMNSFRWAVRRGAIGVNPVTETAASFESVRSIPNAARALTPAEIRLIFQAFDEAARNTRRNAHLAATYRDILLTLTATGARIGEVLALFPGSHQPAKKRQRATLIIDSTIVPGSKGEAFQRVQRGVTKSGLGYRALTVPGFVDEILQRRVAEAIATGSDLLFVTTTGTSISPANFRTRLRSVLESAGLGDANISPHSWRKTVAEAIREGDLGSEGVAQQLGNDPATAEASGLAPVEWTPHKRECALWQELVGSLLPSTKTRP